MSKLSSEEILAIAREHGYLRAGLCSPEIPEEDQTRFLKFLQEKRHGMMDWLQKSAPLRLDPAKVFSDVKSILVLASYYRDLESEEVFKKARVRVARYAHGRDYHKYLRKKGKALLKKFNETDPELRGRIVVDSAPVLEKVYARKAGVGWQGKHTNMILPEAGSWFFLSVLFLSKPFPSTPPLPDLCRDCRLCIDACPTQALEPYKIDSRRCLSYITIEAKDRDRKAFAKDRKSWIFGCDICQEVCPYNRNPRTRRLSTEEEAFRIRDPIRLLLSRGALPKDPEELRRGSAIGRVSIQELKMNLSKALAHAEAGPG